MAADKTLEVQLKTNIAEENAKAEKFDGTLKKIVKTNNELNSSKSATRTGSRAADAALGVSGGGFDSGLQRGTTGAGGRGSERDFARQAQGLGGLVHLYATFAANIYAVGAAFSALQKAADFERMEKSASRMSVVLGINLNAAAKAMVNLTDGAVSYAEAIEKTNLAASAGLSTEQMSRLTKVAKGASTALGRDMGDSLNRLVKGTVKLEPELLDELGILTKASEAYSVYAAGVGKTADELTKFEKTQAFVNAVISEGESKFSSLYSTVEANPYTKLQASLENIGKESLVTLNKGLTPIVDILSKSPNALVGVLTLLVTTLVKMAIPSITQFGDKAAMAAEKASKEFDSLSKRFEEYAVTTKNANISHQLMLASSAELASKEVSNRQAVINITNKLGDAYSKANKSIVGKDILSLIFNKGPVEDASKAIDRYIANLDKAIRANNRVQSSTKYSTEAKTSAEARNVVLDGMKKDLGSAEFAKAAADYNNNLKESSVYLAKAIALEIDVTNSVRTRTQMRMQERLEVTKLNTETIKNLALASQMGASFSQRLEIVKEGFTSLTGLLNRQASEGSKTFADKFSRVFTGLIEKAKFAGKAMAVGLAGYVGKAFSGLMGGFMAYTMIVDVFGSIVKGAIGEAKSLTDLNTAIDSSADSHKILSDRVNTLNAMTISGATDIDLYAKAQHLAGATLSGYSDNMEQLSANVRKLKIEMATGADWTKFSEGLFSLFGKDTLSKTAEAMARNVQGVLAISKNTAAKIEIANILGIDESVLNNTEALTAKMKQLEASGNSLAQIKLQNYFKELSTESFNAESRISSLRDALKTANDEAEKSSAKQTFKDVKYEGLYNELEKIGKLKNDPVQQLVLYKQALAGISPALQKELAKNNSELASFFNSEVFRSEKFTELFNLDPALKKFKGSLDAMEALLKTFVENSSNYKIITPTDLTTQLMGAQGFAAGATKTQDKQYEFTKQAVDSLQVQLVEEMQSNKDRLEAELTAEKLKGLLVGQGYSAADAEKYAEQIRSLGLYMADQALQEARGLSGAGLVGQTFTSKYAAGEALGQKTSLVAASRGFVQNPLQVDFSAGAWAGAAQQTGITLPKIETPAAAARSVNNFPKDRLQTEKADNELLQLNVKLEESRLSLINEQLKVSGDTLGIYGAQYDSLILQKNAQILATYEAQKKYELDALELKKREREEAIKNSKDSKNKAADLAHINKVYQKEKEVLANSLAEKKKQIDLEQQLNVLKIFGQTISAASSVAALSETGKTLSENLASYAKSAVYMDEQVSATKAQLEAQVQNTKYLTLIAEKNGNSAESSKAVVESKKQELELASKLYELARSKNELDMKSFELSGQGGITKYLTNAANEFGYVFREQLKASQSVAGTLVKGIATGLNSSIDEFFRQVQEGTLDMKNLGVFFQNTVSNAFRDAAAQSIKNLLADTIGTLLNPAKQSLEAVLQSSSTTIAESNITLKSAIEANKLALENNTLALQNKLEQPTVANADVAPTSPSDLKGWGADVGIDTGTSTGNSALEVASEKQVDAAKDSSTASKTFLKASDTMFIAGAAMLAFQGKWEQVAFMFLAQLATTLTTMAVTGGSSGGGMWGSLATGVASLFANGGIMTQYGPVQLNKYAKGGVATGPQLALYGEGSKNEAYVPLPDNRTIPVTLSGNQGSEVNIGDTTINVSVEAGGSVQTSVEGNAQMAKMLGQAIKKTVQEELINQSRPGGMFYR